MAVVLAAAALLLSTLLLFAFAAMLKQVRELQHAVMLLTDDQRAAVEEFAGSRPTLVVAVDSHCMSCRERLDELEDQLPSWNHALDLQVVTAGEDHYLPERVAVHARTDPELLARLGVSIFPTGLVFDPSGNEVARSVLGSPDALDDLIAWAVERGGPSSPSPVVRPKEQHDAFRGVQPTG